MTKLIVGNWKMHGSPAMAQALVTAVAAQAKKFPAVEVAICPPFTLLRELLPIAGGVRLGGQDCHTAREGAHTGDISALMLKDAGCAYVIVGHSERRANHGETDETVRQKAAAALEAGLIPIICIGETLKEREAGRAVEVVKKQIEGSIPLRGEALILAYEPVWAIGTGKTPTPDDIRQMHAHIISAAAAKTGLAPDRISVLYGGSVNAANAAVILATEGVSGVLVGGASLKAEEFCKIIEGV